MKHALVSVIAACIVLSALSGLASGDGMPVATVTVHRTLRENRQIALVDVGGDGNETISLYISITSLEPGNKATVLVPLKTAPNWVRLARTNDSHFESGHHMRALSAIAEKADSALGDMCDSCVDSMGTLAIMTAVPMGLYVMTAGYMSGGGGYYSEPIYVDDGLSASVASFGDVASVNTTFAALGIPVPDDLQKTIDEYGAYNAAIINVTTRPPIDEIKYRQFETSYPGVLGLFKEYVAEHDSLDISIAGYGKLDAEYFTDGRYRYLNLNILDEQLAAILSQVHDPSSYDIFTQIILATYGLLPSEGFELTASLPLDDGKAFFPLGTSPSWSGQGDVKVAFKIPSDKGLNFNKATAVITMDGSRYYLFDYGPTAPDYDLEAKLVDAGLVEWLTDQTMSSALWISDNRAVLGFMEALAVFWIIWLGVCYLLARMAHIFKRDRKALVPAMASGAMLTSIFFSFLGGLFFCFIFLAVVLKESDGQMKISRKELRDIRIHRLADALSHRVTLRAHEVDDRFERLVR
ncbi:MAG: hypothetical protein V1934_03010 [Methanobacteriota archaeon]